MKNKIREEKAITVIALLITVIVMVMIAVVTAFYSTNMIDRAENASDTYQAAQQDEENKIGEYEFTIDDRSNTKYTSSKGTQYRKYEVWTSNQTPGTRYQDCENMETIECPNWTMNYPYNRADNGFSRCTKLVSIKIPLAIKGGHYTFSNLPALKYIELGSIGHPWEGAGYFANNTIFSGYGSGNFGTPAGVTIVAYMNAYNKTAGFMGTPAKNTTIIIRSAETGEILEPAA